jgi:hypothetical protein
MPRDKRYPTEITPQVAARNMFLFFVEDGLGLDVETAEELASSDEELKDILESAKVVARRSSIRFGGAI